MNNLKNKNIVKKDMKLQMKGIKIKPNKVKIKDKKNIIKFKGTKKDKKIKASHLQSKLQ